MKQQKSAGILFIAFPLILQIPFSLLAMRYNYPDILREPTGQILQKYEAGGTALIAMWYGYALSILVFVGALLQYESVSGHRKLETAIKSIGLLSAIVQLIALLRWTFVVPFLSKYYFVANSVEEKAFIEVIFTLQHHFLGVGLGEHLGQLSLVVWTTLMVRDQARFHRVIGWLGLSSALVLGLGLTEHLSLVFGFNSGIFAHGALVGFMLWSLWLIVMGAQLMKRPKSESLPPA